MTAAPNNYMARLLPLRLPRVCVAVTDTDPAALVDKAEALVRDNTFLEFRLDYIARPPRRSPSCATSWTSIPRLPSIATCRRAVNGGKFKGRAQAQLDILTKAGAAGFQLVDIEMQSAARCKTRASSPSLQDRVGLDPFLSRFQEHQKAGRDAGQNAATPGRFLQDRHHRHHALRQCDDDEVSGESRLWPVRLVGLCMGEQGIISRVLGVRAGSVFTFAAVGRAKKTASRPDHCPASCATLIASRQVDAATRSMEWPATRSSNLSRR